MPMPPLMIFDCDGVLVDSEIIAADVEAKLIAEYGIEMTAEELAIRFAGLTFPVILDRISEESGQPLSASLIDRADAEIDRRLGEEVEELAGAREAIETFAERGVPTCICSNSTSGRLEIELEHVGLWDYFTGHVFPAREVGTKKAKPAPDVFLHACKTFGVAPAEAFVIEDSVHGVAAASAAGCRVIGFTGASHSYPGHADALTEAGATTVIKRLRDLPATVEALAEFGEI
ncbi:HAD family phosphatase [Fulvimarina sp. 2208YS6-2-32]|uniref:HAD family phosphatase n=1 Tax=Fulvimarina uroteuthidis TaxID=3098149 RepID=A0ABU5I239_9HYPH|nr:HAD family phosphatase [Fulvimarina sp. 2208YS6-2-32]MDY8109429.1 HAD family phosphatase [Fulvimarina sp. 2208YS6-2-32]